MTKNDPINLNVDTRPASMKNTPQPRNEVLHAIIIGLLFAIPGVLIVCYIAGHNVPKNVVVAVVRGLNSLAEERPHPAASTQTSWTGSSWTGWQIPSYSSGSSYSGGTVHVRGYTRRNGTYVHSYTRRSPRRR